MAIWPSTIDDPGDGEGGTALDDAFFDQIKGYIDANTAGQSTIVLGAGTHNNVILPDVAVVYIDCNPIVGEATITGFANARTGQQVFIRNGGGSGSVVKLVYASPSSTKPLYNNVTSGATPLASGGVAQYICLRLSGVDYYCLASHEQGKAIRVPYNAANYSWGVDAADVHEHDYYLNGNRLTVNLLLRDTTISAADTVALNVLGWPFIFPSQYPTAFGGFHNGAIWTPCTLFAAHNSTYLSLTKLDNTPFPIQTNNIVFSAQGTFAVL